MDAVTTPWPFPLSFSQPDRGQRCVCVCVGAKIQLKRTAVRLCLIPKWDLRQAPGIRVTDYTADYSHTKRDHTLCVL